MIRKHKTTLIVTSLTMLLPMLVGLLLWEQLPEQVPSHWGIDGQVDGWSSKAFAVFGFPAILLALHWLCVLASTTDPKHKNYHPKMIRLVLWLCPVMTLILNAMVYATALGYALSAEIILPLIVGLLFLVVGNLLPKCQQSYTMGIKLPWTLASEENWNKTHRFAGKLWVIGGIFTMATAIFGCFWILIGVLALMTLLPTVYSYQLYRRMEHQ